MREKKRAIVESTFSDAHQQLAAAALRIARDDWRLAGPEPTTTARGAGQADHRIAHLSDLPDRAIALHEEDKRVLSEALQSARIGSPEIDGATFDFLGVLFTKSPLNDAEADFIAKWQQLTPAVMAKGVEDTTFYCFDRLVSCNEVGSQAVAGRHFRR